MKRINQTPISFKSFIKKNIYKRSQKIFSDYSLISGNPRNIMNTQRRQTLEQKVRLPNIVPIHLVTSIIILLGR